MAVISNNIMQSAVPVHNEVVSKDHVTPERDRHPVVAVISNNIMQSAVPVYNEVVSKDHVTPELGRRPSCGSNQQFHYAVSSLLLHLIK